MAKTQEPRKNVVYGICTNTGGKEDGTPCSKCKNKEKQAIKGSKDFVCEECGEPLTRIDNRPPTKPPIVLLISLVVIACGVGAYFAFFRDSNVDETVSLSLNKEIINLSVGDCDTLAVNVTAYPPDANVSVSFTSGNTDVVQVDNMGVVQAIAKGETTIIVVAWLPNRIADKAKVRVAVAEILPDSISDTEPLQKPIHGHTKDIYTKTFSFGKYVGEMKNGIPEGDGKMYYYRHIQIAKHDTDNPPHYAESGDWFEGTWGNGDIISGALYNKDGEIKEKIFAPKPFNPYNLQ